VTGKHLENCLIAAGKKTGRQKAGWLENPASYLRFRLGLAARLVRLFAALVRPAGFPVPVRLVMMWRIFFFIL